MDCLRPDDRWAHIPHIFKASKSNNKQVEKDKLYLFAKYISINPTISRVFFAVKINN